MIFIGGWKEKFTIAQRTFSNDLTNKLEGLIEKY